MAAVADECQRGTIASCGSSATRAVNSVWTIAGRASASSIRRSARRVIGIPSACARKYNRVTRSRRSCGEYHFARGLVVCLMGHDDGRDEQAPPDIGRIPRYRWRFSNPYNATDAGISGRERARCEDQSDSLCASELRPIYHPQSTARVPVKICTACPMLISTPTIPAKLSGKIVGVLFCRGAGD